MNLVCVGCGRVQEWRLAPACDSCGGFVDVEYDLDKARIRDSGSTMERFRDLLPIRSAESMLDGGEGNTRCLHARELGKAIGLRNLWVKVEGDNPSGSTKDRQGTVVIAALCELGIDSFVTSSTGNSCTAMARIIARFPEMHLHIFVGDDFVSRVGYADAPNVSVYRLVGGSFVQAGEAAVWFARTSGYARDIGFFFFAKREALKTVYLEAALQIPHEIDVYVQSVSSGIGVYAAQRAALELRAMNLKRTLPRLICVQEESCSPMVKSFARGAETFHRDDVVAFPQGIAKATHRGDPSRTYPHVQRIVIASGGSMLSVDADAIRAARELVKETEGLEICFASAMTIAAARRSARAGQIDPAAVVLLNLTGRDRGPSGRAADYDVRAQGGEFVVTAGDASKDGEIVDVVADVLRRSQQLPESMQLDATTALLEGGLALDSVAVLELLLALETRIERRLEEHEVTPENLRTVGSLAKLVAAKLTTPPIDA